MVNVFVVVLRAVRLESRILMPRALYMQKDFVGAAMLTLDSVTLEISISGSPQMMPAMFPPIALAVRLLMVMLRTMGVVLVTACTVSVDARTGLTLKLLEGDPTES